MAENLDDGRPSGPSAPVVVTLPDGARREFAGPVTGAELAAAIGPGLAKAAIAVKVDGRPRDLATRVDHDAAVAIITRDMPEGLEILRHDAAHVMAEAVKELYPETQVTFGPATETGFYYDFARDEPFTPEDLEKIEARMRDIVHRDEKITREVWDRDCRDRVFRRHRRALQGRIHRRDPDGRGDQPLPPGQFRRSLRRPASAVDRPSRPGVQADERGRRLLARRLEATRSCSASTAPPGRPRRSSTSTSSGSKRPSAATIAGSAASSTCSTCRKRRSAASSGTPRAGRCFASSRTTCAAGSTPPAIRGQGAAAARPQPVGSHRPLGEFPREHVHRREPRRAGAGGQADELPGPCADLPQPPAQLSRIAAAPRRIRQLPPQRAVGRAARHHAGARLHPGRRAHLLHRGPGHRRGDRVLPAAAVDLPRFRLRGCGDQIRRPAAAARSAATRSGTAPSRTCKRAVEAAGLAYTLNPGEGAFYGPKLEFAPARRARPRLAMRHACSSIS